MSKETYTPWDSAKFLNDDETIVEYLKAALEEHDPVFFAKALGNVARAKGMTAIAQKTQLGRQNLYRALSGQSTPRIDTLMKVLDSLGVQFTVVPKTTAAFVPIDPSPTDDAGRLDSAGQPMDRYQE